MAKNGILIDQVFLFYFNFGFLNKICFRQKVDQYFYGSNKGQQDAGVQYILDSVVEELNNDPNKRFVYVEMAFFYRWWNLQNDSMKIVVQNLVDQKRLEFVVGGWCMNDEATTFYNDMIDQQTLGLQFILQEFGDCARPRSAW
jgi:lysosomal alpha-mannosidase